MQSIQFLQDWMPTDDIQRAIFLKFIAASGYKPITLTPSQEEGLLNGCLGADGTGIFEVTPIDDSSRRNKRSGKSRVCSPTPGNNLLFVVEDAYGNTFQILHVSIDPNIF